MQNYFRAAVGFVAGRNLVTFRAAARPDVCLFRAEGFRFYFYFIRNHKRGIEPYAELTDYRNVFFVYILVFFLKGKRTAFSDSAEIVFEFFRRHTDTVIFYRKSSVIFVGGDFYREVLPRKTRKPFFHSLEIEFVDSVAAVGNKFSQENFFMSVNRVDHKIEYSFGLCFETFHIYSPLFI